MSEAKDKFYALLVPKITALGFEYKKSKNLFTRTIKGMSQSIVFKWDGRGGTTILDNLEVSVKKQPIEKNAKIKEEQLPHYYTAYGYCAPHIVKFPVMYSRQTLDLANNMNFSALAKLPFEDKYPAARIQASADFVEQLFIQTIIPLLDMIDLDNSLYQTPPSV